MKKINVNNLIEELKNVHNNKYDYSEVEYKNWRTKVCIICPEHGEFWQTLYNHAKGQGCPKCGKINCSNKLSLTTEEFIKRAREVHGDKYDYSKVEYVNNHSKVCIICPEHGEFWQIPANHLNGCDCPKCKNNFKKNTEEFIKRAREVHGDKYDYSKVNYINNRTKVCIICPEHGEFWQTPNKHLSGQHCPYCTLNKKLEKIEFIDKARGIHGNRYDYSKVNYINNRTKVCIICPEHGEFWQTPANHLSNHGCPKCKEKQSKLEKEIKKILDEEKIIYIFQYKKEWLKFKNQMSLDFYLPDYNIAIECQGEQHFKPIYYFGGEKEFKIVQKRDKLKKMLCEKNNIKLLYYSDKKYDNEIITEINELLKRIKNV
jgi:hypothetical protein